MTVLKVLHDRAQENWARRRDHTTCKEKERYMCRPLTLQNLDEKVQLYIKALRKAGTPINATIVMAAAEGIVKTVDCTLLFDHGAYTKLTLDWAYQSLTGWAM